jgi:hypothetical protein
MHSASTWANLRREGPMSAYAAVAGSQIASSKLLLSILRTEYETPTVGEEVGMEMWMITRQIV